MAAPRQSHCSITSSIEDVQELLRKWQSTDMPEYHKKVISILERYRQISSSDLAYMISAACYNPNVQDALDLLEQVKHRFVAQ